ncbi:unnamed protein product [Polarella glacialis]|uniref:Uncharacterized protein n=1 Tax=Polarella glacialis TaxID=89957 RepID=A0A813HWA3_POLGL|nr:unnamed protein product [Polarella glacialis]
MLATRLKPRLFNLESHRTRGMAGGGKLLEGTFDEEGAAAGFKAAVSAWRSGHPEPAAEEGRAAAKPAGGPLQVGQAVFVRDYEEQSWTAGVVTSLDPVKVQPKGKEKSFEFLCVQREI